MSRALKAGLILISFFVFGCESSVIVIDSSSGEEIPASTSASTTGGEGGSDMSTSGAGSTGGTGGSDGTGGSGGTEEDAGAPCPPFTEEDAGGCWSFCPNAGAACQFDGQDGIFGSSAPLTCTCCLGCFSDEFICQDGASPAACGRSGESCKVCGDGTTCIEGECL